jgi:DNA gyrase subunit A
MAKQLNLIASNPVISTALHTEMQRSYLEYAMSVIVGRALPDVRDGLKPVHRRIIYAMHELGLTPDRPFRKCARVVGDVLGKYHPHGDQAVYDALVRMVQDFSSRYPLLAGHGNFGSVDDDPPAAMRYTETRLAAIAHEAILSEVGTATVDFVGNFDNSQAEPVVLPAQLPILLLNGSSGIAVGMATNIPPHNLSEVVEGLIALIDQPNLSDDQLFQLIPGPDFPTGGEIMDTTGIREAYATGRGSIPIRGVTQIEETQPGRGRHRRPAIVVTELPYQVNKAGWIEKVAELVNQGRLEGIADVRDESDREGMRVVIELKRESNPGVILKQLYRQTPLQTNFGVILLALVDNQPRQLTLRGVLQSFLSFREETLSRQFTHELTQAETRSHLLDGLLLALSNLDRVIQLLREAPDGASAKTQLQEQFNLSDRQADAILSMPLRRLTGMEQQNLQAEQDQLQQQIADLRRLLGDRRELLKALKKDLRSLKRKFSDPRRTRILGQSKDQADESATVVEPGNGDPDNHQLEAYTATPEETIVELTHRGYIRRLTPKTFQRQRTKVPSEVPEVCEDAAIQTEVTDTHQGFLALTRNGRAYPVDVREIPSPTRGSRGTPLISLLPPSAQSDHETAIQVLFLPKPLEAQELLLLTQQARIKRIAASELANVTGRGLILAKLKDDDALIAASFFQPSAQVVLASFKGRLLRFELNDQQLPLMSRAAQGLIAMRLGKQEQLAGWALLDVTDELILISQQGYLKRIAVNTLRLSDRGELGMQGFQFKNRGDALAGLIPVLPYSSVVFQTNQRLIRIAMESVVSASGTLGSIHALNSSDPKDPLIQVEHGEIILSVIPYQAPEVDHRA